jgi:hypothetical protein
VPGVLFEGLPCIVERTDLMLTPPVLVPLEPAPAPAEAAATSASHFSPYRSPIIFAISPVHRDRIAAPLGTHTLNAIGAYRSD